MEERGHLKDFFEGDNQEPQNDLWAPIQAGIEPKRKRRLFFWWIFPIALVGIGFWMRSTQEPSTSATSSKQAAVSPSFSKEKANAKKGNETGQATDSQVRLKTSGTRPANSAVASQVPPVSRHRSLHQNEPKTSSVRTIQALSGSNSTQLISENEQVSPAVSYLPSASLADTLLTTASQKAGAEGLSSETQMAVNLVSVGMESRKPDNPELKSLETNSEEAVGSKPETRSAKAGSDHLPQPLGTDSVPDPINFLQIRSIAWTIPLTDSIPRIPTLLNRPSSGDTVFIQDPNLAKTWNLSMGLQLFYLSKDMRINQLAAKNRVRIENANQPGADRLAFSWFTSFEKPLVQNFAVYIRPGLMGIQDQTEFQEIQPEVMYFQSQKDLAGNEVVRPVFKTISASVSTRQLLAMADVGFRFFPLQNLGFSVGAGSSYVLFEEIRVKGISPPLTQAQKWNTQLTGGILVKLGASFCLEPSMVYCFQTQFEPHGNIQTRPILLGLAGRWTW